MNTDTNHVIVTIHGQESSGKKLKELARRLSLEPFAGTCQFVNIRYPRLLTLVDVLPWVRTMTAKYIASRLETIRWKFANHKITAIAHSNGTRATAIALKKTWDSTRKYPRFEIHNLILLGSSIERSFDWNKYPHTNVLNFISTNGKVIIFVRLYGMGRAGRYGFKIPAPNLRQLRVKWGHSGFLEQYRLIRAAIWCMVEGEA